MPVALQNAANANDKNKFKEELSKYWKSLEKNITSPNQPEAYKIKGVSGVKINSSPAGFSNITFSAMGNDGKTKNIKVYIPDTDDLTKIKDFYIDIDGKKSGTAKYTGIEKGASYVQLELAKILYPGKSGSKTSSSSARTGEKDSKDITLMPAPKVPKNLDKLLAANDDDKKEDKVEDKPEEKEKPKISKNKSYHKVKEELDKKLSAGILGSFTSDNRIISSMSMIANKGKYTPVITFSFRPNEGVDTEKVADKITNALDSVKQYISNVECREHKGKAMQVWIDINQ